MRTKLCICGKTYTVGEKPCHGPKSPYLDYHSRCQFAVETLEGVLSPAKIQVMKLERMLQEDDHD